MNSTFAVTTDLVRRFKLHREAQVSGHEQFVFQRHIDQILYVRGQDESDKAIPVIRIMRAIELVRRNPAIYSNEPLFSHTTGVGHISNIVWSILHVMSLAELLQ